MKNTVIFGFLMVSAGISLIAMDVKNLDDQLLDAVRSGKFEEAKALLVQNKGKFSSRALDTSLLQSATSRNVEVCKLLLAEGANRSMLDLQITNEWPLRTAVRADDLNMTQFLIEEGVDLNVTTGRSGLTVLMRAQNCKMVEVILTTIPRNDRIAILQAKKAVLLAHNLASRQGVVIPQRDLRKIITNEFLNTLVDQQMKRIEGLLDIRSPDGNTAYQDSGIFGSRECLNFNNPATRANLRRIVEANVRKILFSQDETAKK